ncbi:putative non-specific lipid-transfer protein-like protein-like [Capsicum annuum]|nr:putative non-specific lipid-transfer protein-like protein-like [Capsicum annuum]
MAAAASFVDCPHLARIEGVVDVENLGSQSVLEKVGFTKEGVLRKYYLLDGEPRDVIMFSLLSTDPQPQLDNLGPNISRCAKSSWEEE